MRMLLEFFEFFCDLGTTHNHRSAGDAGDCLVSAEAQEGEIRFDAVRKDVGTILDEHDVVLTAEREESIGVRRNAEGMLAEDGAGEIGDRRFCAIEIEIKCVFIDICKNRYSVCGFDRIGDDDARVTLEYDLILLLEGDCLENGEERLAAAGEEENIGVEALLYYFFQLFLRRAPLPSPWRTDYRKCSADVLPIHMGGEGMVNRGEEAHGRSF